MALLLKKRDVYAKIGQITKYSKNLFFMLQSTSGLFYQTYHGLDYIKYSYICNSFNT